MTEASTSVYLILATALLIKCEEALHALQRQARAFLFIGAMLYILMFSFFIISFQLQPLHHLHPLQPQKVS